MQELGEIGYEEDAFQGNEEPNGWYDDASLSLL